MRIEPNLFTALTEPRLNDNNLVLWLTDNGKTNSLWRDYSGKNNHGTVFGAGTPPSATPGALGYLFDGVDDYVTISNFNYIGNTSISLSIWIKTSSNSETITRFGTGITSRYLYLYINSTGSIVSYLRNSVFSFQTPSINNNLFHHIVYVYNGTSETIYIDSIKYASNNEISLGSIADGYIGSTSAGEWFNGSMDEVKIWNRELSASEIARLFNSTRGKFGV